MKAIKAKNTKNEKISYKQKEPTLKIKNIYKKKKKQKKTKKNFKKFKTVEEYINVLCIYLPSIKTHRRESIQAILPKTFPPPIITC